LSEPTSTTIIKAVVESVSKLSPRVGKQMTLWIDVDDNPPRHRMLKGVHLYREQMVGEGLLSLA
jgi:hypothetical protein